MAVTFPRTDILTMVRYERQPVWKLTERQELSRQANGQTRGKSLGSAIWFAEYKTEPLRNDDAVDFEAALRSLDGVIQPFEAGDLRRIYPRSDPTGAGITGLPTLILDFVNNTGFVGSSPKILGIGGNNKTLSLEGVPPNYLLRRGDYVSWNYGAGLASRALHQIVEDAPAAYANGTTQNIEVRPHFRPGTVVGLEVRLLRPSALMTLDADSISTEQIGSLHTAVSFRCVQYI